MRRIAPAVIVLALIASACSSDTKTPTEVSATKVSVKTSEYKFDIPASFSGGLVELTIDNSAGAESHEAELTLLDAGKTLADFQTTLTAKGPPPAWTKPAGGPGPVLPGKSAAFTANLGAGTYVLVCNVPAQDGKAHLEKGMVAEVAVTDGKSGALPTADVEIATQEFAFTGVDALKAGSQTVKVTNTGKQAHHSAVFVMAPSKKTADIAAFFGSDTPSGPPPFVGVTGLIGTQLPGGESTRTLELDSGTTYVFICFIPDTDGTPHFAKGMSAEVTPA